MTCVVFIYGIFPYYMFRSLRSFSGCLLSNTKHENDKGFILLVYIYIYIYIYMLEKNPFNWGPPSLQFHAYRVFFPWNHEVGKWVRPLHPVQKLRTPHTHSGACRGTTGRCLLTMSFVRKYLKLRV